MKKIIKTEKVTEFDERKEFEELFKKLWKQYHCVSPKEKKILKSYIEELEEKIREETPKSVLLVANPETGEKLSNYEGDETFIILLKNKYKQLESSDGKKHRIILSGNNSIYTDSNLATHRQLVNKVIVSFAKNKLSESDIKKQANTIKNFVEDIMSSKHYFSGRYDSASNIAYIWDFPNEEIVNTLQEKYPAIKEIHY